MASTASDATASAITRTSGRRATPVRRADGTRGAYRRDRRFPGVAYAELISERRSRLGLVACDRGDGGHRLPGVQVHHAHAGGVAALRGDLPNRGADEHPARRREDHVVVEVDHERGDDVAAHRGEPDPADAHAAPTLPVEPLELRALAVPGVGDDEEVDVVAC